MTQPKKSSEETQPKKYKLNADEIGNIKFRRTVMGYIADAINNEMAGYIYTNVKPRLGIKDDAQVEMSEDGEWILEFPPKEDNSPKIVLPNGMKVEPTKTN